MAYIIIKRGKFLQGYSVWMGSYSFEWTHEEALARRFGDDTSGVIEWFARLTGGRAEHRPNTRLELRELGRRRMADIDARPRTPDVHDAINTRVSRRRGFHCAWCRSWVVGGCGHLITKLRRDRSIAA